MQSENYLKNFTRKIEIKADIFQKDEWEKYQKVLLIRRVSAGRTVPTVRDTGNFYYFS